MSDELYAHVVLPVAIDRPFTYSVPASLRDRSVPGTRAIVHFRNRILTGYIVDLAESTDVPNVRPLVDLPDPGPIFAPELLELTKWMADYYCSAWGEALQCAVPPGSAVRSRVRYALQLDQLSSGRFTERQRGVIVELHRRGTLTEAQLAKAVGGQALSNTLRSLVSRGILRAETYAARPSVSPLTETWVRLVEERIPSQEDLAVLQRRAPRQAAVYLDLLHGEPERRAALLAEKHGIAAGVIKGLVEKGLVERIQRESLRTPDTPGDAVTSMKHPLNVEQQAAYEAIVAAVSDGVFQTFLLHGVTGSGKTEVYLQAIERALELGRDAIILVPEISLTPQTVGRFKARFQTDIAVLHSALGAGERYDEWRRAQRGDVRIVVGARSAVFAPLPNVGIIIVDEEHDGSYKQGDKPRYHARDVAIMRANMNNAVCVLGSATPSIESYYNSETGKSTRLELRHRATQGSLPDVRVLDMRGEKREPGGNPLMSRVLESTIQTHAAANSQVLLLLNRRGFAPFVLCPQCGWVAECRDCNVSMTHHAKGAYLLCHYCGARRGIPQVCDQCHFNPLLFLGMGTQRIEDYLMRAFPDHRIERMDADTTSEKGGHAKILGRLAAREIDILIGTQMIAKGHDYPAVTLVGVINADTGLSMPDFRAAETTFQLLTQVAGRAGRGDRPGEVLVQTYRPNHYAVRTAAQQDYHAFYEREIAERKRAGYPPFRRMASLSIEHEDLLHAERATALLHRVVYEQIEALGFAGVEVLGPAPATVRRVKRKYRWNLAILSRSVKRINTLARATRDAFEARNPPAKTALKIDLDPYGVF